MLRRVLALSLLAAALPLWGQKLDPVKWSMTVEPATAAPGSTVLARIKATIEEPWHMYSATTQRPPIATTVRLTHAAVESTKLYQTQPVRKLDPNFGVETETFDKQTEFLLLVTLRRDAPAGTLPLEVQTRYQACTDKQCLPPVRRTASAILEVRTGAPAAAPAIPAGFVEVLSADAAPAQPPASAAQPPVQPARPQSQSLSGFLLLAFGFGLAAIFTPCVFPMIPITMSFFLNRENVTRRQSLIQAAVFCLGMIVLFSGMGLLVTALLGPFGVVQLGSNPWVNAFIATVFLVFGLSLLGAFEITIPSGVLSKLNQASEGGGYAGTLLMGLTFSLTSFACVGPFVGTLLAASVQGGKLEPVLGMMFFAAGLALPFFVLAMFPSYLKKLPRSGGWLARVKVVMGFVILAAMLKYLSNIDQVMQWNFLTRERFLAAWFVLFLMPGLYLLGFLRMEGIRPDETVGLGRVLSGIAFMIFAVALLPGMFGAPLGELDAYVPLGANASSSASNGSGLQWMKNDYEGALKRAREENKPVFVNFTGYACTNCHWMKANMFTRRAVTDSMRNFVLVELYTDGADRASEDNQRLQEKLFQTIAIPYYAILAPDGRVLATFPSLTRSENEWLAFLDSGSSALAKL